MSLATMLTGSWQSSGQDVCLCGLGMANSKSGYYNLLSSCQVLEFPGWSKRWKIHPTRHLDLEVRI